ncbi:hypothetical protein FLACOL_01056 [Flavobacterium columnare]|uniref:Uncharacterized protein n=2 Tax=Flavobacterium TaxID=237 RepID=A0ABW8PL99_9FLAO|nr:MULTISPECIES: hypothetical protein [Flavobacterium]QYS89054.1 hypothetical protein JJC05_00995 [Flavobacterium davisii]QYS89175.1 hypothetical protein JJC05_01750 [Flavobacterium davisii]SPE77066.1 hypothetical protein FLACOL_01056 [Flavobacterium columnare]
MGLIFKNWKTTSAGVVSIASGVLLFVNDKTKIIESLTAVLAGIGLIFSQDAVK